MTYWLDKGPKVDPSKVEIRIEMPGLGGGGLPGLDGPGGLPGLTPPSDLTPPPGLAPPPAPSR